MCAGTEERRPRSACGAHVRVSTSTQRSKSMQPATADGDLHKQAGTLGAGNTRSFASGPSSAGRLSSTSTEGRLSEQSTKTPLPNAQASPMQPAARRDEDTAVQQAPQQKSQDAPRPAPPSPVAAPARTNGSAATTRSGEAGPSRPADDHQQEGGAEARALYDLITACMAAVDTLTLTSDIATSADGSNAAQTAEQHDKPAVVQSAESHGLKRKASRDYDRTQSARKALQARGQRTTSKHRGVTHHLRTSRWEAHMWMDGKQVYLGGFSRELLAALVHDLAAVKARGVGARTNYHLAGDPFVAYIAALDKYTMEDVLAALRDYSRAFTVRTKPTSNSRGASKHARTIAKGAQHRQPGSYSPASKPAATLAQASPPGQAFAAGVSTHAAAAAIRHVPPTKPAHIPPVLVTVPTLPCAVAPARTRRIHPGFTRKVAMSVPRGRAEGGVDERGTDPRNKHAACEPRKTLPVVPHEVVTIEDSDEECDPRPSALYRGVFSLDTGQWVACVGYGTANKYRHLGVFATEEEAARAYDRALVQDKGVLARTNFPVTDYMAPEEQVTTAAGATDKQERAGNTHETAQEAIEAPDAVGSAQRQAKRPRPSASTFTASKADTRGTGSPAGVTEQSAGVAAQPSLAEMVAALIRAGPGVDQAAPEATRRPEPISVPPAHPDIVAAISREISAGLRNIQPPAAAAAAATAVQLPQRDWPAAVLMSLRNGMPQMVAPADMRGTGQLADMTMAAPADWSPVGSVLPMLAGPQPRLQQAAGALGTLHYPPANTAVVPPANVGGLGFAGPAAPGLGYAPAAAGLGLAPVLQWAWPQQLLHLLPQPAPRQQSAAQQLPVPVMQALSAALAAPTAQPAAPAEVILEQPWGQAGSAMRLVLPNVHNSHHAHAAGVGHVHSPW